MSLSYWEKKEWFSNIDHVVVGSGIVGLNCALELKRKYPSHKVLVLEKGILPQGASTKNAGFACFGSVSELLSDLKTHSQEEVFHLVKKRWEGLLLLRKTLGDETINYQQNCGHELFMEKEQFEEYETHMEQLNELLLPIFHEKVYQISNNKFDFKNITPHYISNQFEGQLNTGKMMQSLLQLSMKEGIHVLNGIKVLSYTSNFSSVTMETSIGSIKAHNLFLATNGFAKQLFDEDVKPARAQVLITKPIQNLDIKGTFHLDEGYYYFRNIDNRILLGGGRNLDFKTEETDEFGQSQLVQDALEKLLQEVILPKQKFEVDQRWSGIMGVGNQKKAIVKQLDNRVYCGVRLGGMGVAIGTLIGKELAQLLE